MGDAVSVNLQRNQQVIAIRESTYTNASIAGRRLIRGNSATYPEILPDECFHVLGRDYKLVDQSGSIHWSDVEYQVPRKVEGCGIADNRSYLGSTSRRRKVQRLDFSGLASISRCLPLQRIGSKFLTFNLQDFLRQPDMDQYN